MTFRSIDARKVNMPYIDNLVVHLNIGICILERVLVDPVADMLILYNRAFKEMGFDSSVLNPLPFFEIFW